MPTEIAQSLRKPQNLIIPSSAQHQYRVFRQLLEAWAQAEVSSRPGDDHPIDVATLVNSAKASLERGSTPYITLLLIIAPAFLSADDRELEVLEVEDA